MWPRWLGYDSSEIVKVSQRHHACLHFLIWLHEQTGEAASAFIAAGSGWPNRSHSGISKKLISYVAAWNMRRVVSQHTPEMLAAFGKMGGNAAKSQKAGWHGLSSEQLTQNGKLGVEKQLADGRPARAMSWIVTHPNGFEETVFNLAEFCRNHSLSKAHMCAVFKGHRSHHKQFKVREA